MQVLVPALSLPSQGQSPPLTATSTCSGDPCASGDPPVPAVADPGDWFSGIPHSGTQRTLPRASPNRAPEQQWSNSEPSPSSPPAPPMWRDGGRGWLAGSPAVSQPFIPARCHCRLPQPLKLYITPAAFMGPGNHLPPLSNPRAQGVGRGWSCRCFSPDLPFLGWKLHRLDLGDSESLGSEMNPTNSLNLSGRIRPSWGGGAFKELRLAVGGAACPLAQTPGPAKTGHYLPPG